MSEALLTETFIRLETDLRAIGARWALVGGLAVSVRSEPRTTRDIDRLSTVRFRRRDDDSGVLRGIGIQDPDDDP